jgi:hypothetical protein
MPYVHVQVTTDVDQSNKKILGDNYKYVLVHDSYMFGADTLRGLILEVIRYRLFG